MRRSWDEVRLVGKQVQEWLSVQAFMIFNISILVFWLLLCNPCVFSCVGSKMILSIEIACFSTVLIIYIN